MAFKAIFSLDVESMGLYGEGFAVGVSVRDPKTNQEIDSFYAGCPMAPDHPRREWLEANVIPHLPKPDCETPRQVRDKFWDFYLRWRDISLIVADCATPVEANFFRMCVMDDLENRQWLGPYPLHELATAFLFAGMDPIGSYERMDDEQPAHNPLNDARQSGRLFVERLLDPKAR